MSLILLYLENFVVKKLSIASLSTITIILFTIGFAPYLAQDAFAATYPIPIHCNYGTSVEFDKDQYFYSDYYYVTVVAPNDNHDSDAVETVSVLYWDSNNSLGRIGMPLEETGPDTGIFTNTGVDEHLTPSQVSKHVESSSTHFMITFYDACTGNTSQDVVEVLSEGSPVVEPEPEPLVTQCYGASVELDKDQYLLSDYVHITLVAPNANRHSDAVETASVSYFDVGKSRNGMALEETGPDTGIFTSTGVNERLTDWQLSRLVESAPAQFMVSYYDFCTSELHEYVADILSDDSPVVEPEPTQEVEHDPVPIPNPPPPAPAEIDIKIALGSAVPGCELSNSCFNPSSLFVDVGETITWYNADTAAHTVTSVTPYGVPDGNFDSSLIMSGSTFSVTLTQPGTYTYFSMMHPWTIGEIIVQGSGTTPTPEPVIESTPEPVIEVTEVEHEPESTPLTETNSVITDKKYDSKENSSTSIAQNLIKQDGKNIVAISKQLDSQTQSKVKSLDSKILREQSQYDEYYKQYQYYEGKTLSSSDEQKFQRVIEKLDSQNEKISSLIDERNIVVLQSDDLSELIGENNKLREELERQGEQIDDLNEEVDMLKQIIQSIQGFFSSVFG